MTVSADPVDGFDERIDGAICGFRCYKHAGNYQQQIKELVDKSEQ